MKLLKIVNKRKKQVSRMAQEFSQTEEAKGTQPYLEATNCHSLVPGMSQYGESDVDAYVGTAQSGGLPFSTDAASSKTLPLFSNGSQGSNSYFQPTIR